MHAVYIRGDVEDTPEVRAACAALVLPQHCVVSDRSAAWLHGIDAYDYAELALPPQLEVVSMPGRDRTRRAETLGGKRDLLPGDVCEVGGVLVTTPLRTACDLACQRGRTGALAVLDAFRRTYGLEVADFGRILPRYVRRRGVIQLRELIGLSSALAESPAESWTRMTIIDEGLPAPELQIWVYVQGYGWVRLDMGYERLRIAVEYDGEEFHVSDEDRRRDKERRTALRRAGWIVIVVRRGDFKGSGRERWIGELKDALAVRVPIVTKRIYSRGPSRVVRRHPRARR